MYKNFFGFKERPFQLVPNPAYLFLSRGHEEAMAHLSYAISQGDGFVEITGEVGTGKTTLCRAFLENLDNDTEAAYIFNPKLDSIQLLKAINDEFNISSDAGNTKDLIDTLNSFLMEKKADGKRVILIIDEAQNLSKDVLEQVRLLSNLETVTSKLLQIILVGQPELGEMLDSYELRQLGQRISLSCHLTPLTLKETREYIQHRLHIASQKHGTIFTWAAILSIYKYSRGIPRLINIAGDRALLTAFGLNRKKVTSGIAKASIRELAGRGDVRRYSLGERKGRVLILSILCIVLLIVFFYRPGDLNKDNVITTAGMKKPKISQPEKTELKKPKNTKPDERPQKKQGQKAMKKEITRKPVRDLGGYLGTIEPRSSRQTALKVGLDMWGAGSFINRYLNNMDDDLSFFRFAAKQNGLVIHRVNNNLNLVRKLNLPTILEFYLPGNLLPRYLTISKMDNSIVTLRGGGNDEVIEVGLDEMKSYWSGTAYILWKNFLNYAGIIPTNAPRDSIITLKMLMQDIGFSEIKISPVYDKPTMNAVKVIQERHGLRVDGIVGPLTKIVLYNEKKSLKIPHIIN